ncbi:hypothetical protein [Erwinia tracheiphila]
MCAFRDGNPVFQAQPSYLVDEGRSIFRQSLANPVQTLNILLLNAFFGT